MNTKFDVGDEVFIVGKVTAISLNSTGIKYTITIKGHENLKFSFDEKELLLKKRKRGI